MRARFGPSYKWFVLAVISMGIMAAILLSTSFTVTIPALMQYFAVGQTEVQLVITAFMVANTTAMLPAPWLVQRYGLRRCFLTAITILAVSSILGALSPNFIVLILTRIVQGAVAGILFPLGAIVTMSLFAPNEQGRAHGLMGIGMILIPAVAPLFGGVLIDTLGWQAVFLMCLPFCALSLFGAIRYLALPPQQDRVGFDWSGMLALSAMTVSLLGAASSLKSGGKESVAIIAAILVALISLIWFLRHAKAERSIVTRSVLLWRPVSMAMIVSFAYGLGLYGSSYQIPVFLQTLHGYSATEAGGILLPCGIALAVTLPVAGMLADRFAPHRMVMLGLICYGLSSVALWYWANSISYIALVWITVLGRVGIGLLSPGLNKAGLFGLRGLALGQGAMVINYMRMLGGFLGVALLVAYVEWRSGSSAASSDVVEAYRESFLLSAAFFGVALVAAWRMRAKENATP